MIRLYYNDTYLDVQESDSSYRYRALKAKPVFVLKFSLPEFIEIPVGAWCEYMGQTYTLNTRQDFKKQGSRNFEYTLTMGGDEDKTSNFKFRNPVDGRLKWSMHAKPHEFIDAVVAVLNERDGGWSRGTCIDAAEQTIEFNHAYIDEAIEDIAETFDTEWEIKDKVISLCRVEYFKEEPLKLSYGRGNGFIPGVGRTSLSDEKPIKRVYVQGGSENIDPSRYGSQELLLPKSQTLEYEGRTYQTDAAGLYIERTDVVSDAVKEDSLDCSEIYPKREGTVSTCVCMDEEKNFYDITDETIPDGLDFNEYLIAGETAYIRFQTGMLSGEKDFEFKYIHEDEDGNPVRRFELVPQEIDGQIMPNATFKPAAGDTYAIFGVMLPDSYICDNDSQTGASWEMFREGARFLYENEDQKFTFAGELQGLWAKRNWASVGGKLIVGGYVKFTDEHFAPEGVLIRITGIKEFLTAPYSPVIELSNKASGTSIASALREIEKQEIKIEQVSKSAQSFTKRRFRDAIETMGMLEKSLLNFSSSINPIAVHTMQLIAGDESLQFRFVDSKTNPVQVAHNIIYDNEAKVLTVPSGIIQHMTLGINSVKSEHDASEYMYWDMNSLVSPYLDDEEAKYYLYAKASKSDGTGEFLLSETAIELNGVEGYYHFLVGVLNSEYEGERSFVTLYGFTEILPGRITTDKIVSTDGKTYFDLALGEIGGKIKFTAGSSGLKELAEWAEVDSLLEQLEGSIGEVEQSITDLNTYVDGAFADGIITESEAKAIKTYINTINSTKETVSATFTKLYANAFLTGDAKTGLSTAKESLFAAIANLITSIETAITDGKATEEESLDVDAKYDAFNTALSAFYSAVEVANESIQTVLKGYSDDALKKAEEVEQSVTDLNTYVDGAFADGIITEAEAKAIETYINTVNNAKESVLAEYNGLYASSYLGGDAKTGLASAKTTLITAIDALISSINTAISDGKTTAAEKADVDTKFDAYNSAMSAFKTAVEVAHDYINTAIYEQASQALSKIGEYEYLKEAMKDATQINGGLILSSLIALGRTLNGTFTAFSGLNGIYDSSRLGGGIAAWYGGACVDKDDNPNGLTPAVSVVRFDGSGYYANGAISWDSSGNLSVSGDISSNTFSIAPLTMDSSDGCYPLPAINGRHGLFYVDSLPCASRSALIKTFKVSGSDKILEMTGDAVYESYTSVSIYNNQGILFYSTADDYGNDRWVMIRFPSTITGIDTNLDASSENPVANSTLTAKFAELEGKIGGAVEFISSESEATEEGVLYVIG